MKKKKKILKVTYRLLGGSFLIVVCLLAMIVLASRISGGEPTILDHQIKAVLSGSMEPTFQTGSIITIKLGGEATSYQKGDIITFQKDQKLITHRIIEVYKENEKVSYKTKGDNNDGPDLWTVQSQDIVGKYANFTIPYVGYAMNIANSKLGSALLLFIPGLLLFLSALRSIIGAAKDLEAKKSQLS
ncbi:signal peptidase I SipW [Peribacillus alkalitolerans]|uniref:signal peptidase I SipW n=1 Tax=Peribacillus alkalitolerans TaxID=1550385 RepID=UPI0013D831FC|nr:signal peptidase I [Peribacillus alkalitolerans]